MSLWSMNELPMVVNLPISTAPQKIHSTLLLFDLYCPVEIEEVKVSSKIGEMFKKPVPEVVLDLYDASNNSLWNTFTLSHTFATLWERYHTLGSVRKCEKVKPNLCVKKSGKKSVRKTQKQSNKKIHFFREA
jgi:hypothetical protein